MWATMLIFSRSRATLTAISKASLPEPATYDSIGVDYASQRRADPRIASRPGSERSITSTT